MSINCLHYFLLIRSNEEKTVLLKETTLGNENILKDVWSNNVPLKVIIHGWKYKTDESDDYIFAVKRGNFRL